ncbi:MAG TPA: hypothetical protein VJP59_12185 [Gemmatimonadota bacterium]|nr:hypothetical protein [Gemmatimonadota bacterium]
MIRADRHWTDDEIVRWVDEGAAPADVRLTEHLDGCEACRARIAGMEALFAALGTEPPATTGAEMAAQRDRILAAVRSRPRPPVHRLSRRSAWLPAVAAAIAALILWAPRGTRLPETAPTADAPAADTTTLAVVVDANRAAEEVVEAAGEPAAAEPLTESSPSGSTLPDVAESTFEDWSGSAELEREFAALPREDREAILTELASADFDPLEIRIR